jgi:hypothetical protein
METSRTARRIDGEGGAANPNLSFHFAIMALWGADQ